jgi:ferritin-like protein
VGDELETRAALKRWLRARLTEGERPKDEWHQLWEATWDHLLSTPVRDLIDPSTAKALADRLLDPELLTRLSRPVVATVASAVIAELRKDERPVDRFLPPEARDRLQEILARPNLVHPDWVLAMFRGEAAEAVLNDALYGALKEFSTLLPRLMVKVSPMGRLGVLGSAGAFVEKLIEELEKAIEPEIRSFLANRTKFILARAADFTIAKLDEPASIEFRSNFVHFILSRSPAFFLGAADEELIGDIGDLMELTARNIAEMPEMRADIHSWIDRVMEYCAARTLGEVLDVARAETRPPLAAWAEATWPAFVTVLTSTQSQTWIDSLVDELIDQYERDRS